MGVGILANNKNKGLTMVELPSLEVRLSIVEAIAHLLITMFKIFMIGHLICAFVWVNVMPETATPNLLNITKLDSYAGFAIALLLITTLRTKRMLFTAVCCVLYSVYVERVAWHSDYLSTKVMYGLFCSLSTTLAGIKIHLYRLGIR